MCGAGGGGGSRMRSNFVVFTKKEPPFYFVTVYSQFNNEQPVRYVIFCNVNKICTV